MITHMVDVEHKTVIAIGDNGKTHDMNAQGPPCTSLDDLRHLVGSIHTLGLCSEATRDHLLDQIPPNATHGGRREGAGRPAPKEPYATASYYIPTRIKDGIQGESLVHGFATASELAEQILGKHLDDQQCEPDPTSQ